MVMRLMMTMTVDGGDDVGGSGSRSGSDDANDNTFLILISDVKAHVSILDTLFIY